MPSLMTFPTRIIHGRGAARELPAELKRAGAKERVFLVTDHGILKANLLRFIVPLLEQAGLKVTVWPEAQANPDERNVAMGAEAFKASGADSIVGVGRGSALDAAKAIALLAHHDGPLSRYAESQNGEALITDQIPPLALVPTTAGTGSEVSRSLVLVIEGVKTVISSDHLLADAAILDAELTVSLPAFATAVAGLDALGRNLEAYLAKGDHPLADAIALDGLARIARHLKAAVKNPRDLDAREQLMLASAFGSIAAQKGLGASNSVARALLPIAGTQHGLGNAVMLTSVIHFNHAFAEARMANAAVALGFDSRAPAAEAAAACAKIIGDLRHELGVPGKLSHVGVKHEQIPEIVERALADLSHLSSPRPVGEVDFERMINDAF
jgi:4-hydroxybutyrate dehydrogenase